MLLMGAKAWFIAGFDGDPKAILADSPALDRAASLSLAERLLPGATFSEEEDGGLDFLNPKKREIYVGDYGDLKIVAHADLAKDFPSRIDPRWRNADLGPTVYLHATHSVVDWGAFALWRNGDLLRAVSVSPDSGIIENVGEQLPFESSFWDGSHSLGYDEAYPLPFDPLELAEAALLANLGFQFEGNPDDWVRDPVDIPIMRLRVSNKAWWKFW